MAEPVGLKDADVLMKECESVLRGSECEEWSPGIHLTSSHRRRVEAGTNIDVNCVRQATPSSSH